MWSSWLARNQWWFLGAEVATVVVTCLGLNFFNPAFVFEWDGEGSVGSSERGRREWWGKEKRNYVDRIGSPESDMI